MAVVNIPGLSSQIRAMNAHLSNTDIFLNSLRSILLTYSENKYMDMLKNDQGKSPSYQIPEIVFAELDSSFKSISRSHPKEAIGIADLLWEEKYLEPKKFAITIISNLDNTYGDVFIDRIKQWVDDQLDAQLVGEILSSSRTKSYLTFNDSWLDLISKWLVAASKQLNKNGLIALGQLVSRKDFQNLPKVFGLITPIFSQPELTIQKDLITFIKSLINRTQAETASFLIMLLEIYPSNDVYAFIRKCLPLFDDYYQEELRRSSKK